MPKAKKKCATEGCSRPVLAKGLCKSCYGRLWRLRNLEKVRKYNRQWREQHPDYFSAYQRRWRKKHPNREKTNRQKWFKAHPGRQYQHNKNSRRKHPETRNRQRRKNYLIGREHNQNSGQYYSIMEMVMILFKIVVRSKTIIAVNVTDRELAKYLERSVLAIQARRCLIRKDRDYVSTLTFIKKKLKRSN